jgi:hypothetical protein
VTETELQVGLFVCKRAVDRCQQLSPATTGPQGAAAAQPCVSYLTSIKRPKRRCVRKLNMKASHCVTPIYLTSHIDTSRDQGPAKVFCQATAFTICMSIVMSVTQDELKCSSNSCFQVNLTWFYLHSLCAGRGKATVRR